jgi:hypothetical protein
VIRSAFITIRWNESAPLLCVEYAGQTEDKGKGFEKNIATADKSEDKNDDNEDAVSIELNTYSGANDQKYAADFNREPFISMPLPELRSLYLFWFDNRRFRKYHTVKTMMTARSTDPATIMPIKIPLLRALLSSSSGSGSVPLLPLLLLLPPLLLSILLLLIHAVEVESIEDDANTNEDDDDNSSTADEDEEEDDTIRDNELSEEEE